MTKFKNVFLLAAMAVSAGFVGCNKGDDGDGEEKSLVEKIEAKWEITDPASSYASFEFNKDGYYIVVEKVKTNSSSRNVKNLAAVFLRAADETNLSPIHTGTYTIEGDKIILSGFGTLDVISTTAEEFNFSFTLEATGEKDEYRASKAAEPISASNRTELLCRTWKIEKVTVDESVFSDETKIDYYKNQYGNDWQNELKRSADERSADMNGWIVLFSRASTYLVLRPNRDSEAGLSEWKWTNNEETAIYYSWDNWEDGWEDNIVSIELTSSTLKIYENDQIDHCILAK